MEEEGRSVWHSENSHTVIEEVTSKPGYGRRLPRARPACDHNFMDGFLPIRLAARVEERGGQEWPPGARFTMGLVNQAASEAIHKGSKTDAA